MPTSSPDPDPDPGPRARASSAGELPVPLYTAAGVRGLDRTAIDAFEIPGATLMERAGAAAFAALRVAWPGARRLLVVCGAGNNGGDGFVVARLARAAGLDVSVVLVGDAARITGDAGRMRDRMERAGLTPAPFTGALDGAADCVVDALFGTGLDREVTGRWRDAIEAMNRSACPRLAIDIPSGLHADTGAVLGSAVRAAMTVSFIGLKRGMFTGAGREHCGRIRFDDLGVPPAVYDAVEPAAARLDLARLAHRLRPRSHATHKGSYGHVLVVGGDVGFAGAARLAGEAAARVGAGLVSIATRAVHAGQLGLARPELMVHPAETPAALGRMLERATVVAVGPGLGQSPWAQAMLDAAGEADLPLVVDADGLNLLARAPRRNERWILTPHPGEAGRLLGTSAAAVEADRFAAARAIRERYGGICVLKGSGTLVEVPGAPAGVCVHGNPGMATGGTGDLLTGAIAGLVAQGFTAAEGARLGVAVHARAGDLAARDGERGMIAGDVVEQLRRAVNPEPRPR